MYTDDHQKDSNNCFTNSVSSKSKTIKSKTSNNTFIKYNTVPYGMEPEITAAIIAGAFAVATPIVSYHYPGFYESITLILKN